MAVAVRYKILNIIVLINIKSQSYFSQINTIIVVIFVQPSQDLAEIKTVSTEFLNYTEIFMHTHTDTFRYVCN